MRTRSRGRRAPWSSPGCGVTPMPRGRHPTALSTVPPEPGSNPSRRQTRCARRWNHSHPRWRQPPRYRLPSHLQPSHLQPSRLQPSRLQPSRRSLRHRLPRLRSSGAGLRWLRPSSRPRRHSPGFQGRFRSPPRCRGSGPVRRRRRKLRGRLSRRPPHRVRRLARGRPRGLAPAQLCPRRPAPGRPRGGRALQHPAHRRRPGHRHRRHPQRPARRRRSFHHRPRRNRRTPACQVRPSPPRRSRPPRRRPSPRPAALRQGTGPSTTQSSPS